jgi:NADH dehydrogenase
MPRTVLVIGGSGFVGRHIVNRLAAAGDRVIVPTRRRDNARALILLPSVNVVEADVGDAAAVARLAQGADAVVNLVGILNEGGGATFSRAHVEVTQNAIAACGVAGVRRFVQMSALNASADGPSDYQRSKAEAEAAVRASGLDWTIFQPSVIFGPEDSFLNMFAKLARILPVIALPGAKVRFQPVYVGDVADCFVRALDLDVAIGRTYPLCGPRIYTLAELVRYVSETIDRPRPVIGMPDSMARLQATVLEYLPGGLMSRDNLKSMSRDSVCGCDFPPEFGVTPAALEAIAPGYLSPDANKGRYDGYRKHGGR